MLPSKFSSAEPPPDRPTLLIYRSESAPARPCWPADVVMKTVLALSSSPAFAQSISEGINGSFKFIHRVDAREADPILRARLADACIFDYEADPIQAQWNLDLLRQSSPVCPVIVYLAQGNSDQEEAAYAHGATYVLTRPVRLQLLKSLLDRLLASSPQPGEAKPMGAVALPIPAQLPAIPAGFRDTRSTSSLQALDVVRDFSVILTQSLNSEALLKEFLLLARSILGVNRAAIYLRENPAARTAGEGRRLRSASA